MSTYRSDDSITDENFIHTDIPQEIEPMTEKVTPDDADVFVIEDSGSNWYKRKITWANIKATIAAVGGTAWGSITGTLSDQSDLQSALDSKAASTHTHQQSDVTGLTTALDSKLETVSNSGAGVTLAKAKAGTDVPIRSLVAGTNVTLTQGADTVTIDATGGGGGVTDHGALTGLADDDHLQYHTDARGDARYSQLGHNHNGVYEPVFTKNTAFNKDFGTTAGTVAEGNHTHAGLGGEANTTSNAGAGTGLALPKNGVDLPFKSLIAGTNVTLTDNGNDVTIDAAGVGGSSTRSASFTAASLTFVSGGMRITPALLNETTTGDFTVVGRQIRANNAASEGEYLMTVNYPFTDNTAGEAELRFTGTGSLIGRGYVNRVNGLNVVTLTARVSITQAAGPEFELFLTGGGNPANHTTAYPFVTIINA